MHLVAITGLAVEARIARRAGLGAIVAGGGETRARMLIEKAIADGAGGLLSFGICGGLDPALASGALILPRRVRTGSGKAYPVDASGRDRLAAALAAAGLSCADGDLLGAAAIADTPERKTTFFRDTGARAIDLESHLVAAAASEAGLPFIVLRAIADPAGRGLPPAALVGLDADGRTALGPVLRSLMRAPSQLPRLVGLAFETRRALRSLARAARAWPPEVATARRS
ncbi:MAG TPA: purine phosphorylase [Stellaceae bacterium]|nr:purine phosphorylase [Stellaceae bacterium]